MRKTSKSCLQTLGWAIIETRFWVAFACGRERPSLGAISRGLHFGVGELGTLRDRLRRNAQSETSNPSPYADRKLWLIRGPRGHDVDYASSPARLASGRGRG